MYKLIIKTQEFVDEFAQFEIEDNTKKNFKKIKDGIFEIEFENKENKECFKFIYDLMYYSRVIENIYLKIEKLQITENLKIDIENFNIEKIKIKSKEIEVIDLIGFNLLQRDYRINTNENSIPSILPAYCFYLLAIDEIEEKITIIDPMSNLGEIIIEASAFHPRKAFNIKKRHSIPAKKIFNLIPPIPKIIKEIEINSNKKIIKNKYLSIVQENKIFKEQKENLTHSRQEVKISQYETDWLDVKFQEASNDFVISYIPKFKTEEEKAKILKEFFYQAEFIFNESICTISKKPIDKKYFKDNGLQLEIEKIIEIEHIKFYIYILI